MKKKRKSFPEEGIEASILIPELQKIKSGDASWRDGRMFGYVYYPGDEAAGLVDESFRMFSSESALNPSLFGSLKKFENEIVSMLTDLFNGAPDAAGTFTSGGTESILMAVKTARDKARHDHPEILEPVMVIPVSAHPAFYKAAHYLSVRVKSIPVRNDMRADVGAMRKAITPDTILLAASAPCFPHGVIDPIGEIGKLAVEHGIMFHVDACLGGMVIPFAEKLGYPVPIFDFRVPGVTSISADIHKYGYSAKGASVIIYSSHELRKYQFFVHTEWPGGLFGSPALLGTRSGGPVASAWAVILHLGIKGYLQIVKNVMETSKRLQEGINTIPGLKVVSNPDLSLFAFTSDSFDIFRIGDVLSGQGWFLDRTQFPNCLHVTVSNLNIQRSEEFLSAVRNAVDLVSGDRAGKVTSDILTSFVRGLSRVLPEKWFKKASALMTGIISGKESRTHSMSAAVYGITASIDNRKNVHDIVLDVLDKIYTE